MSNEIKRSGAVANWQESMRAALYNGVTEGDMDDIVKSLVERAKKGDLKATDMLFKWTMGQPQVTVKQTFVNQANERIEPIDVTARGRDDPSEAEIAMQALRIRDDRADAKRFRS